ncbi:membrane protein DedA, SNARE-associated domain [Variovorax sp. OV329]|nr:membrane protein DedA, SNARE-associated domain [Variovorax sp. OV329]
MRHGVTVVFLATLAARLGAPVPASAVLVVAGGLIAAGQLSLPAVLAVGVLANVLGDGAWYYAGRRFGYRVMRLLCKVSMSPDSCVRRSETLITDWGGTSLLAAKFVPGVSVVAPPMAGALKMPLARFTAFDALAGLIWTGVFVGLGWVFSQQIQEVLDAMANAGSVGVALLVVLILIGIGTRWWRRRAALRDLNVERIGVHELRELLDSEGAPVVIDVRSEAAAAIDPRRIPGAVLIHPNGIEHQIAQLPRDREIVLYCDCPNEVSAAKAAAVLSRHGFVRVRPLRGGLQAWVESETAGAVPAAAVP